MWVTVSVMTFERFRPNRDDGSLAERMTDTINSVAVSVVSRRFIVIYR